MPAPDCARPNVTRGMMPSVFASGKYCGTVHPMSLRRTCVQSSSVCVWNPSVCRRIPIWNSLTFDEPKIRFHPPFTELSEKMYEPSKKPHFAGPAVISDPYWFELNVCRVPQNVLFPEGRESMRSRLFHRGLSAVS